jgi:hypothetical protein
MSGNTRNIVIIAIVILLGILAFNMWGGRTTAPTATTTTTTPADTTKPATTDTNTQQTQ